MNGRLSGWGVMKAYGYGVDRQDKQIPSKIEGYTA